MFTWFRSIKQFWKSKKQFLNVSYIRLIIKKKIKTQLKYFKSFLNSAFFRHWAIIATCMAPIIYWIDHYLIPSVLMGFVMVMGPLIKFIWMHFINREKDKERILDAKNHILDDCLYFTDCMKHSIFSKNKEQFIYNQGHLDTKIIKLNNREFISKEQMTSIINDIHDINYDDPNAIEKLKKLVRKINNLSTQQN